MSEKVSGNERRDNTRVPARLAVDVPVNRWGETRRGYTTNISQTGLMFKVARPVTLPSTAEIVMTLPNDQQITLNSEVRHAASSADSSEVEVGVQFKELAPEVQKQLARIVRETSAPRPRTRRRPARAQRAAL